MDFKVILANRAIRELEEAVTFIAEDNPDAAAALRDKLLAAALSLQLFPLRFPKGSHRHYVRKMPEPPYIIYYSVNEPNREVKILRFWHAARRQPFL